MPWAISSRCVPSFGYLSCPFCVLHLLFPAHLVLFSLLPPLTPTTQKTHSASILNAPKAYEAQEKRNSQKIIEMDCRGLEFVEFKPDVSDYKREILCHILTSLPRAIGKPRLSSLPLPSQVLTFSKASGMTMMRRRARRLASRS